MPFSIIVGSVLMISLRNETGSQSSFCVCVCVCALLDFNGRKAIGAMKHWQYLVFIFFFVER